MVQTGTAGCDTHTHTHIGKSTLVHAEGPFMHPVCCGCGLWLASAGCELWLQSRPRTEALDTHDVRVDSAHTREHKHTSCNAWA